MAGKSFSKLVGAKGVQMADLEAMMAAFSTVGGVPETQVDLPSDGDDDPDPFKFLETSYSGSVDDSLDHLAVELQGMNESSGEPAPAPPPEPAGGLEPSPEAEPDHETPDDEASDDEDVAQFAKRNPAWSRSWSPS